MCRRVLMRQYASSPRLHLKSLLRLRPSVKFQMHILAPSDKRLPMHDVDSSKHKKAVQLHFVVHWHDKFKK